MNKNTFELTIFQQSRMLVLALLFPITILAAIVIYLSVQIRIVNFLAAISFISFIGFCLYYFTVGHLKVILSQRTLNFYWKRKLLFNYKEIEPVGLDEIEVIIIDQDKFLRKILTKDRVIIINNGNIFRKDIQQFINLLKKETNSRYIDSWGEWKEKGWLRVAFRINLIILVLLVIIIVIFIILKGFKPKLLLFMPFILTQLLLYQSQMDRKK